MFIRYVILKWTVHRAFLHLGSCFAKLKIITDQQSIQMGANKKFFNRSQTS